MRKRIIGSRAFEMRHLVEMRERGDEAVITRSFVTEIHAVEGATSRSFDFIISTEAATHQGDVVLNNGWKLDVFQRNPVVLWMHENDSFPVGRATNLRAEGGKLKSRVEFTPVGMVPFNDTVFSLLQNGFLSATSVGFVANKWALSKDPERMKRYGVDFLEQTLLEFSICTVPANPETLIENSENFEALAVPVPPPEFCSLDLARHRLRVMRLRLG